MLIKKVFQKNNLNNLSEQISTIYGGATVDSVKFPSGAILLNVYLSDISYGNLKGMSCESLGVLKKFQGSKANINIFLDGINTINLSVSDNSGATATELHETLKSRLPFAEIIHVSSEEVELSVKKIDSIPKLMLATSSVFLDHFIDDINSAHVSIHAGNYSEILYTFEWLDSDNIQTTIVNSVKYMELIEFLEENPHPSIEKFVFDFRDSNKGAVAELNFKFKDDSDKRTQNELSNTIRKRLKEKFMKLPIF